MTMPGGARCAVAVLAMEGGGAGRLAASLETARAEGLGDFAEVVLLDAPSAGSLPQQLADAAAAATAGGFDRLLAVSDREALVPDIFVKTAPALRLHDAVWGGAALATDKAGPPKVERMTRLAAQDLPTFFHAALRWWIGPSHFVRPQLAAEAARRSESYADYLYALWTSGSAYKTAQALTLFAGEVPPVADGDRARLAALLEEKPVFAHVRHGEATFRLPYTGLNPVIEREQMRGLFFEQEELDFLADRLPRGMRILDVGANTGNHTVFFAGVMHAMSVVPVEPHPRSVAAIHAAVQENRLENVDLGSLGRAVGADVGMLRAVPSVTAGLGATHYVPDPAGGVPLVTLDGLISGPIDFIKIDVEGMEMEVLAGAAGLIAAHRPFLYVEVLDASIGGFVAWVDKNKYRVEKIFPDKTHCNYLLAPADPPQRP